MAKGRPTSFKPEYTEQVEKLCLLGATDEQLAIFFSVSIQTIHNWKKKHPDFFDALKRGKQNADIEVVNSLFKKAMNGDTTAQIFWLKNRQTESWRDRKEVDLNAGNASPFEKFAMTKNKADSEEEESNGD